MERVVRTFLLTSAAYLIGGVDAAAAGDLLADQDRRLVEELRQHNGGTPEDVSPLVAARNTGENTAGD